MNFRRDEFWCSVKIVEVHCIALATVLNLPKTKTKTKNGVSQGKGENHQAETKLLQNNQA